MQEHIQIVKKAKICVVSFPSHPFDCGLWESLPSSLSDLFTLMYFIKG